MGTFEACAAHGVVNCYSCFYGPAKPTNDKPREEIEKIVRERNARSWTCFVKWTCAGCGERCASEEPNIVRDEYRHEKCGHVTRPEVFGILMVGPG